MTTHNTKEYNKLWYQNNRERVKARNAANKEKRAQQQKEWAEANRDHRRDYVNAWRASAGPAWRRDSNMRSKYGISLAEFNEMLDAQNGCCASCGDKLDGGKKTHVDHCHRTGKVRGILCHFCNLALGNLRDDVDRITRLADYIRSRK